MILIAFHRHQCLFKFVVFMFNTKNEGTNPSLYLTAESPINATRTFIQKQLLFILPSYRLRLEALVRPLENASSSSGVIRSKASSSLMSAITCCRSCALNPFNADRNDRVSVNTLDASFICHPNKSMLSSGQLAGTEVSITIAAALRILFTQVRHTK